MNNSAPQSDKDTVTAEGVFQERDYWSATRYLRNRMLRTRFVYVFFLGMPWVVLAYAYLNEPKRWTPVLFVIPFCIYLIVFAVLPLIDRMLLRRQLSSNPSAFASQLYTFSKDGISLTGSLTNATLKWEAIIKASESGDTFFF